MQRILITDDKGRSVPLSMYENWVMSGGTWRPEAPGQVDGDANDDSNNEWSDLPQDDAPNYLCRYCLTTQSRMPGADSEQGVMRLDKFSRQGGKTFARGEGFLYYSVGRLRYGPINWKFI
jgi:hypothetical protein